MKQHTTDTVYKKVPARGGAYTPNYRWRWCGSCSCGWEGKARDTRTLAEQDAFAHKELKHAAH